MAFRFGLRRLGLGLAVAGAVLGGTLLVAGPGQAAFVIGTSGNDVLFGKDDDHRDNGTFHPAGTMADQGLSRTDVLLGLEGDDLLIGLAGDDMLDGGPGDDVLVGGTEQGNTPNQDIQLGGDGDDISVWAGGDGSELFIGGNGTDAIVFAVIDRVDGVPTPKMIDGYSGQRGIVTADLTGAPGFCQVERAPADSGYEFLVRFIGRANNNLLVTVRTQSVEQVFCASRAGGGAEWLNLSSYTDGELRPITLDRIREINPTVGQIVR